MFKVRKKFIWLFVVAGIFFVLFSSFKMMKTKKSVGIFVKTARIEKQDIKSNIFTSGRVVSKKEREVTPDLTGRIVKIFVHEGDKVAKGQLLAKLDSKELEYDLKDEEINLEILKEKLEQLKRKDKVEFRTSYKNAEIDYKEALEDYENKKELYKEGAISEDDLDTAKKSMEKAYNDYLLAKKNYENSEDELEIKIQEKQIKASKLKIEKIKSDIEKTKILSPIDGTITSIEVSELSVVGPSTVLFNIKDIRDLEVVTNISEYDISKIKLGQSVKITGEGIGDKEYKGVVKYISPDAETVTNGQSTETTIEVKIDIKDKNTEFRPNFTANVEINTASKENALVVPYEAIYTDKDGKKSIFTVDGNKAKKHEIKTGIEGDMVVEVIGDGFKEGDLVILNPTERIKDGIEVSVRGM
ncbi:HlyD family secretion protein [Caminicella sporogenes DSM 14501]|uniref:HlyD family secretion protein n=1 Tax=Caminicella sporogenes DSM 14501 TaxID=1121266 RepID=A0A1M6Q8Z8_9FIRM|nr:efflux RND transporter periplasmic adaptor subunit [Caminicella sporogenes]RKD23623.1 hypothetical protein BET04_04285 [Caminicella sporogenes]SHK16671.1 HlyD family secretion protein [Caminicella sporogenes DSM 14501]